MKSIFCVILCVILLFALTVSSFAVSGGLGLLVPAVIALLESWGVGTAVNGLDAGDVYDWFNDQLATWAVAAGVTLTNLELGIGQTALGQVVTNPITSSALVSFANWMVNQHGITAGGSNVTVVGGSGGNSLELVSGVSTILGYTSGNVNWSVKTNDNGVYAFLTFEGGYYYLYVGAFASDLVTDKTVVLTRNGVTRETIVIHKEGNSEFQTKLSENSFASTMNAVMTVYQNQAEGVQAILSYNPSEDSMDLVPSDVIGIPSPQDVENKDIVLDVGNLVGLDRSQVIDQILNDVVDNNLDATSSIVETGVVTVDQTLDQGAITEQDGVVSWPDVTQPIGVVGLDEIFPFCIPFDVYHFFEALAAEPVAPSFEIPFVIDGVVDYTFEIDLSDFDQVAEILRLMELFAFCVGLAFVTRSMFIRG